MIEHLNLDALADVLAGEPSPHLEECGQCRAEVGALQAAMGPVATALTGLPDPPPPAGLDERISAALAKERRGLTGPSAATVTPLASRRPLTRWLPLSAGIAAAAALVFGGVVLVQRNDRASTSSDKSAAGVAGYRTSSTGADYRKDGTLLARALPSLLGAGAAAPQAQAAPAPGAAAVTPETRAGLAPVDPLANLRTTQGLASCLTSLSDANAPGLPLALDYASFEGQPALVVVLPASKADKVDVFVVGAGCSKADATVLFFTRLAKPSTP